MDSVNFDQFRFIFTLVSEDINYIYNSDNTYIFIKYQNCCHWVVTIGMSLILYSVTTKKEFDYDKKFICAMRHFWENRFSLMRVRMVRVFS